MKAAFVDFVFEDRAAIKLEGCEFEIHPPSATPQELIAAAHDADILLIRDQFCKVTAEVRDGRLPGQLHEPAASRP